MHLLAGTLLRLIILIVVGSGVLLLYVLHVAEVMRHRSDDVVMNFGLIVAWMALLMGISVLEAILAGEFLFGRAWRERVILGRRQDYTDVDVPPRGAFKDYRFQFSTLIALLAIGNAMLYEGAGDGFFAYYNDAGFGICQTRSLEASERIEGIRDIFTSGRPEAKERLMVLLGDPDEAVRAWAVWAVGLRRDQEAGDRLLELLARGEGEVRAEAALALARLGRGEAREGIEALAAREIEERRYAWALGVLAHQGSVGVLGRLLEGAGEGVRPVAAWALGRIKAQEAVPSLVQALGQPSLAVRCSVTEALGEIGDVRATEGMMAAFEASGQEDVCDSLTLPNRQAEPPTVVHNRSFHETLIRAMGLIGDREVVGFLSGVARDKGESDIVRSYADRVAKALGGR